MPVSTRAPACPWNAHGISYLTDEDIYDNPRTGHPTHTFFPVPWTKTYDVTLPPRPPPSFLPYSSLILSLLYSRKLCRLFFFFSISNERVVSKFALFLQRGKKGIFGIVEFGTNRNERSLFRYAYSGRIYHFFVPFGSFRISISKRYNKKAEKDEEKENAVKMIRRYDEEKWRSNESFFKILENKNKRIKSVLMNILLPSFENPGMNLRNLAGISEKLLKRKWTWNRN